jgi:hypothetical protein
LTFCSNACLSSLIMLRRSQLRSFTPTSSEARRAEGVDVTPNDCSKGIEERRRREIVSEQVDVRREGECGRVVTKPHLYWSSPGSVDTGSLGRSCGVVDSFVFGW